MHEYPIRRLSAILKYWFQFWSYIFRYIPNLQLTKFLLISDYFWLMHGNICIINIAAVADDVFKTSTTKQTSHWNGFVHGTSVFAFANNLSIEKSLYCCIRWPGLVRLCVLYMHVRVCLFGWQWGWWTALHHHKDVWKSLIAVDGELFVTTASATWMQELPVAVLAICKSVLHIQATVSDKRCKPHNRGLGYLTYTVTV